jgi:chemotaxis protein CheX
MMVSELEIIEVADAVWRSMLGIEVYSLAPDTPLEHGPFITATVLISGAFEGGVTLELSASVARNLAAMMFGMEDDEVTAAETSDAVGELANMVGGNLKALVPQPARLSLPSVAEGDDYRVSLPGTEIANRVAVGFDGEVLHVVLHRRSVQTNSETNPNNESRRSVA